jgi:methyl coenzyme M reductase beta subunit
MDDTYRLSMGLTLQIDQQGILDGLRGQELLYELKNGGACVGTVGTVGTTLIEMCYVRKFNDGMTSVLEGLASGWQGLELENFSEQVIYLVDSFATIIPVEKLDQKYRDSLGKLVGDSQ